MKPTEKNQPISAKPPLTLSTPVDKDMVILVADDDGMAIKLLCKILRDIGFRAISTAVDGEDAIQTFKLLHPHIVFLDIDMPRLDGLEVLHKIRETDPNALAADFRHSFIVMISAHSTVTNIKQAVASGANGFIVKPYTHQKIIEVIDKFQKTHGHKSPQLKLGNKPQTPLAKK